MSVSQLYISSCTQNAVQIAYYPSANSLNYMRLSCAHSLLFCYGIIGIIAERTKNISRSAKLIVASSRGLFNSALIIAHYSVGWRNYKWIITCKELEEELFLLGYTVM
jgi:hypothetical protein